MLYCVVIDPLSLFVMISLILFFQIREAEEPVVETEKNVDAEKQSGDEETSDANKENPANEPEEKEPEDKVTFIIFLL